ncbi:unnamed protein product, partial [marine sediment metagenome]
PQQYQCGSSLSFTPSASNDLCKDVLKGFAFVYKVQIIMKKIGVFIYCLDSEQHWRRNEYR